MTKKLDDLFDDLETKALENNIPDTLEELQKEVMRLRKTLESYSITEELHVTNIEFICQKALDNFKKISMSRPLTSDEAKTLDLLHKNLRTARGHVDKKEKPGKLTTEAELLRIVDGKK
jgi:hypothetical protein